MFALNRRFLHHRWVRFAWLFLRKTVFHDAILVATGFVFVCLLLYGMGDLTTHLITGGAHPSLSLPEKIACSPPIIMLRVFVRLLVGCFDAIVLGIGYVLAEYVVRSLRVAWLESESNGEN